MWDQGFECGEIVAGRTFSAREDLEVSFAKCACRRARFAGSIAACVAE